MTLPANTPNSTPMSRIVDHSMGFFKAHLTTLVVLALIPELILLGFVQLFPEPVTEADVQAMLGWVGLLSLFIMLFSQATLVYAFMDAMYQRTPRVLGALLGAFRLPLVSLLVAMMLAGGIMVLFFSFALMLSAGNLNLLVAIAVVAVFVFGVLFLPLVPLVLLEAKRVGQVPSLVARCVQMTRAHMTESALAFMISFILLFVVPWVVAQMSGEGTTGMAINLLVSAVLTPIPVALQLFYYLEFRQEGGAPGGHPNNAGGAGPNGQTPGEPPQEPPQPPPL